MKPGGEFRGNHEAHCSACGQVAPSYDIVNYGSLELGYRRLCGHCFNREVAKQDGLEFEDAKFVPSGIADCVGEVHEFHFRTHLLGSKVALDAFELHDGHPAGYQFQIIGDSAGDLLALLGRLIERIRRALSRKHLTDSDLGTKIADQIVRGRIEWDDTHDGCPMLIIDGQEVAWEDFGRMLMSFEGFQFQLNCERHFRVAAVFDNERRQMLFGFGISWFRDEERHVADVNIEYFTYALSQDRPHENIGVDH
jgi:hypothetical protein